MTQDDPFQQVKKTVGLSIELLEEVNILDFTKMPEDVKDFVLSQIKKTIGKLGNLVIKHE